MKSDIDTNNHWYDLNKLPDNYDLSFSPSEYWLLITFYMLLSYKDKNYLILEYPSYSTRENEQTQVKECIWSTPYLAYKIETGPNKYSVISHIKKLFNEFISKNKNINHRLRYKFYHMGISYYEMSQLNDILELKRSPREPDKWKCFFVQRYIISNLDKLGRYNLIDPECIMPYQYLCLEEKEHILRMPDSHKPYHQLFRGKPLSSNVAYLFFNNEENALLKYSTEVRDSELYYKEEGFLLSFDLVSYGLLHNTIVEEFKSLVESGHEIAQDLMLQLASIFRRNLDRFGYYQTKTEGDGFIAASPKRHHILNSENIDGQLAKQIAATLTCIRSILEEINTIVRNSGHIVNCRCSLIYGDYVYGKIGGLYCAKADFAGENLIRLSRMQSALRKWQYATKGKRDVCLLSLSSSLFSKYNTVFNQLDFEFSEEIQVEEKESNLSLFILSSHKKLEVENARH